jgi:hypothetical protein
VRHPFLQSRNAPLPGAFLLFPAPIFRYHTIKEVEEMSRIRPFRLAIALLLGLSLWLDPGTAAASKLILALGDASYLSAESVKAWTEADIEMTLGEYELGEFAVVILSNISYGAIPEPVQQGLNDFLGSGGSLLITGGPSSYGSGGYQAIADLLPFGIRAPQDWVARPFKPVIPLEPGNPILQGVTFQTIGSFNDLNPKPGAVELARYAGGRVVGGGPAGGLGAGAIYQSPLIAEQTVASGTVVGIAFDLGQEVRGAWPDGNLFVQNLLTYLVARSPLEPKPKEEGKGAGR